MTGPAESPTEALREARSKSERSHIADCAADISDKVGRGNFELKAADAGADVDCGMIEARGVDIGRQALFHTDG